MPNYIPQYTSAIYTIYSASFEILDVINVKSGDIVYTPGTDMIYKAKDNYFHYVYRNDPRDFTRPISWLKNKYFENIKKYNECLDHYHE